jgi:vacuolar-type H+-ATPase subunit I/STV1
MNLREVNGVEVKERSAFGVWGLSIVTLGIYYLVWYYKINKEMRRTYGVDVDPAMAVIAITLGSFIIVPAFVSVYRTGRRVEQTQFKAGVRDTISPVLSFLLSFVLGLHTIYLQSNLNKVWEKSGKSLTEGEVPGLPSAPGEPPVAPPQSAEERRPHQEG